MEKIRKKTRQAKDREVPKKNRPKGNHSSSGLQGRQRAEPLEGWNGARGIDDYTVSAYIAAG